MAPNVQAVGTFQSGGASQLTVPWPAHQADDIGILVIENGGSPIAALSTAAGFVQIPGSPQSSTGIEGAVFWCRATSSSMTSPVTGTSLNHGNAVIFTVRGCVTTGDPWDVISEFVKGTTSTSTSITGDTTTVADCLIAYIACRASDAAANQYSGEADSTTTGLAEHVDNGTVTGNGGGIGVWSALKSAAGAYGPMTATLAGTSIEVGWSIAFKPAASVTAVGDEIALRWDINSVIGDSSALVWDDRAAIGDTSTLRWDQFTTIGDNLSLLWDQYVAVGDTAALLWDLRFALADTLQLVWDADGPIGKESSLLWDVRTTISDSLSVLWDQYTTIGDTIQALWDIRAAVGDQIAFLWDQGANVGDQIGLLWDIHSAVSDTLSLLWDILLEAVSQVPDSVVSNDGWDTGPTPGGNLATAASGEDSDYITVTV